MFYTFFQYQISNGVGGFATYQIRRLPKLKKEKHTKRITRFREKWKRNCHDLLQLPDKASETPKMGRDEPKIKNQK